MIFESSFRLAEKSMENTVPIAPFLSLHGIPLFTSCFSVVHLLHPSLILSLQMPLSLPEAEQQQCLRPLPILHCLLC